MSDRLTLSIEQTAEALNISRNHCYRMARNGELPIVRFGSRMLVPRRALERMLEERTGKAGEDVAAAAR